MVVYGNDRTKESKGESVVVSGASVGPRGSSMVVGNFQWMAVVEVFIVFFFRCEVLSSSLCLLR